MSTTIIRLKRTSTAGDPSVLGDGELAYSAADYSTVAGGGRLYVGIGAETGGDAASHLVIGGQYFTDKLDHLPGTLTAGSALLVDADKKLDNLKVDNLDFNGNTISSLDVNGNIVLSTNGSGIISADSTRISNVANPTLAQDVVTRNYIENGAANVYLNDIHGAGNLQVDGNLTIGGTSTVINAQNLSVADNMIYLNNPAAEALSGAVGDGTDVVFTTATPHQYLVGMHVKVEGVTPSSFDGTYVQITAVTSDTFTVASTNTDTYVSGGTARGQSSANPDLGFVAGYDDGTYAHTGFFRDASDGRFKVFDSYIPEPDTDVFIDTTDASFALSEIQAENFYGELVGNASSATILQTTRTLSISGDGTGSQTFNGGSDSDIAFTLADTGVSAGSYGSQTEIPTFTVDTKGRLTAAGVVNVATTLSINADGATSSAVDLLTETLTFAGGIGLTATATSGTDTLTYDLDDTAVTAGIYGAADSVASFTVDDQGRLTGAGDLAISIVSTQVTDFDEAAQDALSIAIAAGSQTNIAVTYNDIAGSIDYFINTATTSTLGVAKFSTDNFQVTAGNVEVIEVNGGTYA
jgi:hypothetical protein